MWFAISIAAWKESAGRMDINHMALVVEAVSAYEAAGKGMEIASKTYLAKDGWRDPHVSVCKDQRPVDPSDTFTAVKADLSRCVGMG